MTTEQWPSLPIDAWRETHDTLHRWTQIVGKVRVQQGPWINHSWGATLYVTTRGMTTGPMPAPPSQQGARTFAIDFDFVEHRLIIHASDGAERSLPLAPQSVADFYAQLMRALEEMGLGVAIHERPNEVAEATPFAEDHAHAAYDADFANRFWRVLAQTDRIFREFRARFIGKVSPVHYFWGAPDLAVTRFSGREAPTHPGGFPNLPDWITREAYSHEVSSAGFWAGGEPLPYPLFYSYAYPTPDGFTEASVQPDEAFYSDDMSEFVLPYDAVRQADAPDEMLLAFLESTYAAAADLGEWNRAALERERDPRPGGR